MVVDTTLRVIVEYIAAAKPFEDDHAERSETVGHLKARVLTAFGLSDGQTQDGEVVTYTLYRHKEPLEDPSQTLGQLAEEHHVLDLKLVQQLTQG